MKYKYLFILLFIFLITFSSAQLGYNNRNLPRINPATTSTITSSSGGNVSSVTSGDGCIIVSPTIGNVIVSFNLSCASGVGDGSFNATYAIWAYNQTTPAITFTNSLLASLSPLINSTYNSTYAIWSYNESLYSANLLNSTYGKYWYNMTIPSNPFNQNLNTTNDVVFRNVTATNISGIDRLYGRRVRLDDTFTGATFPTTTFDVTTTLVSLFGIPLIRMTGGGGIIQVGAIANGLYLLPDGGINSQLVIGDTFFTHNWLFENSQTDHSLTITAQDGTTVTNLGQYWINILNNVTVKNMSANYYFGNGQYLTGITAPGDGSYNATYDSLNSTYGKFWYNMTIGGSSGSYNSTYNNLINQTCPGGYYVNGTLTNGTLVCTRDPDITSWYNRTYTRFNSSTTTGSVKINELITILNQATNYTYKCGIIFTSNTTTNGIGLSLDMNLNPVDHVGTWNIPFTTMGGGGSYHAFITGNGSKIISTSVLTANTKYEAILEGTIQTNLSSSTTIIPTFANEIAGNWINVTSGSYCKWEVYP